MKKQENKAEFIRLTAEKKSLKAMAEDIGVSNSSHSEREKELRAKAKADRLRIGSLEKMNSYLRDVSIV